MRYPERFRKVYQHKFKKCKYTFYEKRVTLKLYYMDKATIKKCTSILHSTGVFPEKYNVHLRKYNY